MALNSGGTPGDWAFLAMTRWKQNRPDEAREWLARAMLHSASDPEIERFRAEARALLAFDDPATSR